MDANLQKLVDWVNSQGVDGVDLDEIVHDYKGNEAAAINNDGVDSQCEYILLCCEGNVEEAIKEIQRSMPDKGEE